MTSFFSCTSDIFFLISNPEINMTKHSFPVSSHTKVVWAMYSFCCLYYPVKNRENLAVSQVLKNKVKKKPSYHQAASLSTLVQSCSTCLRVQDDIYLQNTLEKSCIIYILCDLCWFQTSTFSLKHNFHVPYFCNETVCNLLSFAFPQVSKGKEKYVLQRHITFNYLRKSDSEKFKPFKSRKHSWNSYFWMHNRVLTSTIVELILFSVKLQVCFLQQPEFCFVLQRSTLQKGKALHRSNISTLDHSKLLGSPFIIFEAFSGPHYKQWCFSHLLQRDQDTAVNAMKTI